ncbi:MAG: phytochelatin synthase family protein [Myxococcota bacterium]
MSRARLVGLVLLGAIAVPVLGMAGVLGWIRSPTAQDLPMPEGLTSLRTAPGQERLLRAVRADHDALMGAFQSQEMRSWCGVASAVTVLNAAGSDLTQEGFFTPATSEVRGWWAVTLGGMPVHDLAGMLRVHGAHTRVVLAEDADVGAFRDEVRANLATAGDWLIVNYDRSVLGEEGGGHLSPLSAYDAITDEVLMLDVSAYKYPPHWVPVDRMFAAMHTRDGETGRSRGWVVVDGQVSVQEEAR